MELLIENVSKHYAGDRWGLRGVTLRLQPGIVGLLGPNGAGKSTLMRIVATINRPTEGRVTWDGQDLIKVPDAVRTVLGYLPQDFGVYPNLTAWEFLHYVAAIKGVTGRTARQRVEDLLEMLNLSASAHRPLGGFSGGMRQRVGIAQALLNDPQLLIVDEPTVGLDPAERVRFRHLLSDLAGERLVILSTHIVADVEAIATEIAILHQGRLLTHAAPEALLQAVEGKVWEWVVPTSEVPHLKQQYLISGAVRRADGTHVRAIGDEVPGARSVTASLEDAFLFFTAGGAP